MAHAVAQRFFDAVVAYARREGLLSDEHFTVDGTPIEAWASLKSVKLKEPSASVASPDDPGNPTVNFHGDRRISGPACRQLVSASNLRLQRERS